MVDKNNWMSYQYNNIRISCLNIPGTHETCALHCGPMVKCQSMNLREQLEAGIRFIDIRCRHIRDAFAIHHGSFYQKINFGTGVRDVCQDFLSLHPSECIIMSIKEEYDANGCTRKFEETFDWYLKGNQSHWYIDKKVPLLGDVRGKIVLFRRFAASDETRGIDVSSWKDNATFEHTNNEGVAYHVQDEYKLTVPVQTGLSEKWEVIREALNDANSRRISLRDENAMIFLNFTSAVRFPIADPHTVATSMNDRLLDYIHDGNNVYKAGFGTICMDFPQQELIGSIFRLNGLVL